MSMKNPLTPAGIEPPTFQFVALDRGQCSILHPSGFSLGKKIRLVPVSPRATLDFQSIKPLQILLRKVSICFVSVLFYFVLCFFFVS